MAGTPTASAPRKKKIVATMPASIEVSFDSEEQQLAFLNESIGNGIICTTAGKVTFKLKL